MSAFVPLPGSGKPTKVEACYREPNATCSACRFFDDFQCEVVDGDVEPLGWCKFFMAEDEDDEDDDVVEVEDEG